MNLQNLKELLLNFFPVVRLDNHPIFYPKTNYYMFQFETFYDDDKNIDDLIKKFEDFCGDLEYEIIKRNKQISSLHHTRASTVKCYVKEDFLKKLVIFDKLK